jgi:hypothetical protein
MNSPRQYSHPHRHLNNQYGGTDMSEIRELDIDLIQTDVEQIQTRLGLDEERVEILCEKYKDEGAAAFPPPIVYLDADGVLWLADGHYRLAAIRKALGPEDPRVVRAEVREGSKRDAIYCAAGANGKHGTQLTWEETRRNIERLLRDPEWGQMSDREIASHTGVSNYYVSKIHRELDAQEASVSRSQMPPKSKPKRKVKRRNQEYPMDVGNIGHNSSKKTAAAATVPTPPAALEVPPTDDDEEPPNDHNVEVVEDVTATRLNDAKDDRESDSDDDRHDKPPKGFVDLIAAWFRATAEDRRTFKTWAAHRTIDEPAGETTPEQHAIYYLIGREVLEDVAQAL